MLFSEALLNAVVFGVQGTAERALKGLWSDDRPQLTGWSDGRWEDGLKACRPWMAYRWWEYYGKCGEVMRHHDT